MGTRLNESRDSLNSKQEDLDKSKRTLRELDAQVKVRKMLLDSANYEHKEQLCIQ